MFIPSERSMRGWRSQSLVKLLSPSANQGSGERLGQEADAANWRTRCSRPQPGLGRREGVCSACSAVVVPLVLLCVFCSPERLSVLCLPHRLVEWFISSRKFDYFWVQNTGVDSTVCPKVTVSCEKRKPLIKWSYINDLMQFLITHDRNAVRER